MKQPLGILTDSHSSISPEAADALGVRVLPMPFMLDGQTYLENVTLSREAFFARQREGAEIGTSQPAPGDVTAFWDAALEDYEQVVYIPLSSGLSGSCQTAVMLSREEPYLGRVFVVDNGRVATPQHRSVLDAIELMHKGCTAAQIQSALEKAKDDFVVYIAVETLDYLKKGGRITPTVAAVGTLLHIKPVLKLATGKLDSFKKCRGMARARETMLEAIRSDLAIRFRDAQARGRVHLLAATSADAEETARWVAQIEAAFPGMPVLCDPLSLGVSCHVGPGGLGVGLSVTPEVPGEVPA
ncbi:MAG: DegV family protein [Aristaeellaceae bacterium]